MGRLPGDGGGDVDHVEAHAELGHAAEVGQSVKEGGVEAEIVSRDHDVGALKPGHEDGIVRCSAPAVQNLHIRALGQPMELLIGKGRERTGF